jgi:hypothetical protein
MSIPFTYVYLLYDPLTQLYKIGKADEPEKRHKQLCSPSSYGTIPAAPTNYELLEAWLCPEPTEKELHDDYAEVRVRGEWFDLDRYYGIVEKYEYHQYEVSAELDDVMSKWVKHSTDTTNAQDEIDYLKADVERLKGYNTQLEAALIASRLCGGEMPKALLPAPQSEYQY